MPLTEAAIVLLVEAIIATASIAIPEITEWVKSISKRGYNTGTVYMILDHILTKANALSSKKYNELVSALQDTIQEYYPGGSDKFKAYLNKARDNAQRKIDELQSANVEKEVYANSANNLTQVYEGLSKRQKKSETGKTLLKQIQDSTEKAVQASKKIAPEIDSDKDISLFNEIGKSGAEKTISDNIQNIERKI